jgi:hypothetical protein
MKTVRRPGLRHVGAIGDLLTGPWAASDAGASTRTTPVLFGRGPERIHRSGDSGSTGK